MTTTLDAPLEPTHLGRQRPSARLEDRAQMFLNPPADVAMAIRPHDARAAAAAQVAEHIRAQLEAGRSLYCIVHDEAVQRLIGGFDGRALPAHCLPAAA